MKAFLLNYPMAEGLGEGEREKSSDYKRNSSFYKGIPPVMMALIHSSS
jgi:hypothetical protein